MSPRATDRRRRRKRPGGALAGAGRWLLCALLSAVVLLFVASVAGLMGRRSAAPAPSAATDVWAIPSQRLDLAPRDGGRSNGLAARVSRLAEGVRAVGREGGEEERGGADPDAVEPAAEVELQAARVLLTNGTDVNRLAARLTPPVRAGGFDVCGVSDADRRDYAETLIIDRCGDRRRAEAVCAYFRERWGVGRVVLQARVAPEADVLVVLGRDLARQFSPGQPGQP